MTPPSMDTHAEAPSIFRLHAGHAAEYRRLMLRAYAEHPRAFTTSPGERQHQPLAWWASRLSTDDDAPEVMFGALQDGLLLGAAGLSFEKREKARHKATLFGMVVATPAHGQGLGRRLVQAVLDHARGRPALRLVQLTVTDGNEAAESLYRACGFERWGVEPLAVRIGEGFADKVHLWCDLRR